ncbi:Oidioi.mRNA.OKI2018_I69.chr1.g2773.t1.cds [Oikopleura dioica]|uniref:Oidioi.mRNA.OKI2018_I69.chr1.g2773.t1.cds n=1 Tax=Oikopleura dioica TaxID=34765 RepID=A0ABN7SWG3_OIKDI|nr:Oidioi.mRNA.OKI2018_I69.chr1.g2773.t1.cds [Oikopleura dioica]
MIAREPAARSATWCARADSSHSSFFFRHLHLEYRSDLRGNGGVLVSDESLAQTTTGTFPANLIYSAFNYKGFYSYQEINPKQSRNLFE